MEELVQILQKMVGQTCWSMIGISAGSMFSLDLGRMVKKRYPVDNSHLRPEQREFSGEFCILVQCGGWRLFRELEQLCHCNDSNANDELMVKGLSQLEGKTMLGFEFGKSHEELRVTFSDGYRLFLCGWEGVELEETAYTVSHGGTYVSSTMGGELEVNVRSPEE